jgi:hypothetical protein
VPALEVEESLVQKCTRTAGRITNPDIKNLLLELPQSLVAIPDAVFGILAKLLYCTPFVNPFLRESRIIHVLYQFHSCNFSQ